jgi:hypothetical protein
MGGCGGLRPVADGKGLELRKWQALLSGGLELNFARFLGICRECSARSWTRTRCLSV